MQEFYSRITRGGISFLICILFAMCYISPSFGQNESRIDIFPPESKPFGLSYEDHITKDWKRILSIPAAQNPMEDKTGERCSTGQYPSNSSVFYLSGNTGGETEITCKVPSGLGLFININNVEASEAERPGNSVAELHQVAKNDEDHATVVYLKIDDQEYNFEDLKGHRFHTDVFDAVFPPDALFGVDGPLTSKVVADGYYAITEPLTPGNHTVVTRAAITCLEPDCLTPNWASEVKYNLIVE